MKTDAPPARAPVAMSPTSLGTIYLYEMRDGDWAEYARRPQPEALEKVRWLMSRIASRSSAAEPRMLTPSEVASLGDDDLESLMDVYLTSPASQWQSAIRQDAGESTARRPGESAAGYFDRLAQWRVPIRTDDEPRFAAPLFPAGPGEPDGPPQPARAGAADASMRQVLSWASAGLAITALLAAAGLGFAALSYFEAKDDHRANEAWRAEMKSLAAQRPAPGSEKLASELAAENARLRHRIDLLEAKGRQAPRATAAAAKPVAKPAAKSPRSPRQAR